MIGRHRCPLPSASTVSLASMQVKSKKYEGLQNQDGVFRIIIDTLAGILHQACLYKII